MSFQEKNITASLGNFVLILGFYLISLFQLVQGGSLDSQHVFRLWGIVVILATIGTVVLIIATHIASHIIHTIKTNEESHIKDIQDERDAFIDLKGTNVAYRVSSIGVALSMLTLVLGQPPMVMFSLLIFCGILAQIIADISRLYFYRRGF
jgi:hypothetical protein